MQPGDRGDKREAKPASRCVAAFLGAVETQQYSLSLVMRIAEVENGARREGFTMVDLSRVAADTVELYEPMAEEKGVTLQFVSHGAPAVMRGDPNLLFAAMANIVDNALKFTPFSGRITIRTRSEERRVGKEC